MSLPLVFEYEITSVVVDFKTLKSLCKLQWFQIQLPRSRCSREYQLCLKQKTLKDHFCVRLMGNGEFEWQLTKLNNDYFFKFMNRFVHLEKTTKCLHLYLSLLDKVPLFQDLNFPLLCLVSKPGTEPSCGRGRVSVNSLLLWWLFSEGRVSPGCSRGLSVDSTQLQ